MQTSVGTDKAAIRDSLLQLTLTSRFAVEASEALHRLTEGTYGRCADCDGRILEARLRVVPEAVRCVTCQSVREQRQLVQ